MRKGDAPLSVKKRALFSLLLFLSELGLSSFASAVPPQRRLLETLLQGSALEELLPASYHKTRRELSAREVKDETLSKSNEYYMRSVFLLSRMREIVLGYNKDI
eukprot:751467-Hanusia_phi.AAC.1